jgi:hypothetical protein
LTSSSERQGEGWFEALTPQAVCDQLARAGFNVAPSDVHIEARDERWLVRQPGQRVAWFAASWDGARLLERERRGSLDVRAIVPGETDPWRLYAEVRDSPRLAIELGSAVGRILSEQHSRIIAFDVAGWLPGRPAWPKASDWISNRLPGVVADERLIAGALTVMQAYEEIRVSPADCALVHTDLDLHLATDATAREVRGVFDYVGAARADRHHDFRYLVFDFGDDELFDAARATYERLAGHPTRNRAAGRSPKTCCGRGTPSPMRWQH